ncbi:hypothetical protein T11_14062 [Trichinella zimbabwensis]|uniref:Uncharacterized protein n=1 Tax=Trichinella zimbabwensis TaxID=268475 RepID=A0A0V1GXZ1_9BILA|nr:hypothetical protein T11_14062 [Trichinella zimbabwensis]
MKHNFECTENGLRTLICPEYWYLSMVLEEKLNNVEMGTLMGFQMIRITFYANLNREQFSEFIFAF